MSDAAAPIRVALLEDDPVQRDRFVRAIASAGHLHLSFVTHLGQAMLQWLENHQPDVLLVDLGLPDIPGLSVIHYCAQRWPTTDMAVITLFSDEAHVLASLEAGAKGYLLKDSLHQEIPALISELYAGGAPMTPAIARYVLSRFRQSPPPLVPPLPSPAQASECAGLSARELEILSHVARGFRSAEVAQLLGLKVHTVSSHLKNIYGKLAVQSKTEAIFEASRMGLLNTFDK